MQHITQETNLKDICDWLSEAGYDSEIIDEDSILFKSVGVKTLCSISGTKNILFMITSVAKEGIEEIDLLRKINEINHQITSGTLSLEDAHITLCFSLIRPFGMGQSSFNSFVDYHLRLMGFILTELGLSEIIQ